MLFRITLFLGLILTFPALAQDAGSDAGDAGDAGEDAGEPLDVGDAGGDAGIDAGADAGELDLDAGMLVDAGINNEEVAEEFHGGPSFPQPTCAHASVSGRALGGGLFALAILAALFWRRRQR